MTSTRLSTITVVKNDSQAFETTLNSVLNYLDKGMQLVVIDSSNNLERSKIQRTIAGSEYHSRIIYRYQEPKGIYPAMNLGANISTAPWLWFLNAGDVLNPEFEFEKFLVELESIETKIVCFPVNNYDRWGNLWGTTLPEVISDSHIGRKYLIANHQGCIINRDAFWHFEGYDEKLRYAADGKLLDQIATAYQSEIRKEIICKYLLGGTSSENFSSLLNEISLYRKSVLLKVPISKKFLLIEKNRIRHLLLQNKNLSWVTLKLKCFFEGRDYSH